MFSRLRAFQRASWGLFWGLRRFPGPPGGHPSPTAYLFRFLYPHRIPGLFQHIKALLQRIGLHLIPRQGLCLSVLRIFILTNCQEVFQRYFSLLSRPAFPTLSEINKPLK